MSFLQLAEPQRPNGRLVVLALGFRPFFLLAALLAVAAVPVWLLFYTGVLSPATDLPPNIWHGHEMIFGFAVAVVAGFLLTAVQNWTGWPTASGAGLAALVALWLAGRIAAFGGTGLPVWVAAAIDIAFLPALAITLAVPLLRTDNRRNIAFPIILLALAAINATIHLSSAGWLDWDASRGLRLALDLILLMIGVLGGRVIPMFTKNAVPQAKVQPCPKASILALVSLALMAAADLFTDNATVTGAVALAAGIVNLLRMRGWGSLATLRKPILWILHVGYGWLALGLILRGLGGLTDLVPPDAGMHALTVGAVGSMVLGMMSRVALGHTARAIDPARLTVAAYWLLNIAAIVRVAAPMLLDAGWYMPALVVSGVLWSLSFLLFLVVYLPILARPRLDGRPG